MLRPFLAAVLVGATLSAVGLTAHAQPVARTEVGALEPGDDRLDGGEYYDVYEIAVAPGAPLEADLTSDAFDTYVIVLAPDGTTEENDDYQGSQQRSFVRLAAAAGGVYRVAVTSYAAAETGRYRLTLTTTGRDAPLPRDSGAAAGGGAAWDGPGRYRVGESVLYRVGAHWWQRGEVLEVGPPADWPTPSVTEHTYLIREEAGGTNYYDREQVTGPERRPYWTAWFVGDWDLSLFVAGMAVDRDGDVGVYRDGVALPPLQIRADGTYTWVIDGSRGAEPLEGRWSPSADGPGVVLHGGEYGRDWKVYNAGDAVTRQIQRRDQIQMTDDAGGSRRGGRR